MSLFVAASAVLCCGQTSQALALVDDLTQTATSRVQGTESQDDQAARAAEKQAEIEARRQAIKQRIADRRAAVTEKLSGERAQRCKKQEAGINRAIDNRASAAEKHLGKFKAIQDKLTEFATDKALALDNARAHELILTGQENKARAAVAELKAYDFDCAFASAAAPGAIATEQVSVVKQALKDYRTALKEYALAIRSAATALEGTSEPGSEARKETDSETGMEDQEETQ